LTYKTSNLFEAEGNEAQGAGISSMPRDIRFSVNFFFLFVLLFDSYCHKK
jgi:hypothetical protein